MPNPQPGGPGYPLLSGPSPSTCPARLALLVANATAGIALRIIWPRKPCDPALAFDKVEIPYNHLNWFPFPLHSVPIIEVSKFVNYQILGQINLINSRKFRIVKANLNLLTSALDGGECSTSRSGRFNHKERKLYPLSRRLGGPQNWSGRL